MIQRAEGIAKLFKFKDKELIKVVSGIRRCGKSTLLEIFRAHLLGDEIKQDQIQFYNLEDVENKPLLVWEDLEKTITSKLVKRKKNYIFLDEVQIVPNFERAVKSLFLNKNIDLYLTGSNAFLLSGEFATLLSGRCVEIHLLPFSFFEYLEGCEDKSDLRQNYQNYISTSSLPYVLQLEGDREMINDYLTGVYNTIIVKDVVTRQKITDLLMLESVVKYMFENIGNITSSKKISDTMTSAGRKIAPRTIESYLSGLCSAFILYKVGRFDLRGKQYLKSGEKYYLSDVGLRFMLLGTKGSDWGRILENVVYLELLRYGLKIFIGKLDANEIDFITMKNGALVYYQVALTVMDEATLARELLPLQKLRDSYPKYILTLDVTPPANIDGIKIINVLDWLLEGKKQ
jgi:predicted AAA+ superfamily ATPase